MLTKVKRGKKMNNLDANDNRFAVFSLDISENTTQVLKRTLIAAVIGALGYFFGALAFNVPGAWRYILVLSLAGVHLALWYGARRGYSQLVAHLFIAELLIIAVGMMERNSAARGSISGLLVITVILAAYLLKRQAAELVAIGLVIAVLGTAFYHAEIEHQHTVAGGEYYDDIGQVVMVVFAVWFLRVLRHELEVAGAREKQARNRADAAAKRYQTLVDMLPLGVFATDRHGQMQFANPAYLEILRVSSDDLHKITGRDVIHPDDYGRYAHIYAETMQGTADADVELRLVLPDGGHVWGHVVVRPLQDDAQNFAGFLGTLQDVTTAKAYATELQTKARMMDAWPGAVVTTDADLHVRRWSNGAVEMFGHTADAAHNQRLPDLLQTKVGGVWEAWGDQQLSANWRWQGEVQITTTSGTKLDTFLVIIVYETPDGCFETHNIFADISANKALEVEQNISLTERNRLMLLRDVVKDFSRALRDPLASMLLDSYALQVHSPDDERVREDLQARSLRAERLIHSMLWLTTVDEPAYSLTLTDVDMLKVLGMVVSAVTSSLHAKNLKIDLQVPAGLPNMTGGELELQQALTWLVRYWVMNATDGETLHVHAVADEHWLTLKLDGKRDSSFVWEKLLATAKQGQCTTLHEVGVMMAIKVISRHMGSVVCEPAEPHCLNIKLPRDVRLMPQLLDV